MNSVKKPTASSEIDDIMNEIQSLQKGMSSAVSKSAAPAPAAQSVKPTAAKAPQAKAPSIAQVSAPAPVTAKVKVAGNATIAPAPVAQAPVSRSLLDQAIADTESEMDAVQEVETTSENIDDVVAAVAAQIEDEPTPDSELAQSDSGTDAIEGFENDESAAVGEIDSEIDSEISNETSEENADFEQELAATQAEKSTEDVMDEFESVDAHEESSNGLLNEGSSDGADYGSEVLNEETVMTDGNHEEGALTMQLTGEMNLKLKYEFDGQEVTIGFVDHQLRVTLSDGTEFRVPLNRASRHLKAA